MHTRSQVRQDPPRPSHPRPDLEPFPRGEGLLTLGLSWGTVKMRCRSISRSPTLFGELQFT